MDVNKKLIGNYTYLDLQKNWNHIYINGSLTDEELNNLQFLGPNATISLKQDNYLEVLKIQEKLKEFNLNNDIEINIKNKESFNKQFQKQPISGNNIYVQTHRYLLLDDYLKYEKKLYDLTVGCEKLSPFEKYIFIYNKVKKLKEYNENNIDNIKNYDIYLILDNKYIHCVGFSLLLGDLLNKVGIENKEWDIDVDLSYDDYFYHKESLVKNKNVDLSGHSRRIVHIIDKKYDIDGFYIADPTWDNYLDHDYYNYLALTPKESENIYRMQKLNLDNQDELFFVDNIEEFYKKLQFILNKNKLYTTEEYNSVIDDLISDLEKLDVNFVNYLKTKYKFINEWNWPDDISDLISDLGNYIVTHVNKRLNGDQILKAVKNVYINAYNYPLDKINEKILAIKKENSERQIKCFPTSYLIKNDKKIIIANEENKFDVSNNKTK